MEGANAINEAMPVIVVVNAAVAASAILLVGRALGKAELTTDVPGPRQNFGEWMLEFFVGKARDMAHGADRSRIVHRVASLLATFFFFILVSNLMGILPIPGLNHPPTAFFSVTLGLAICSVIGTLMLSAAFKGPVGAAKHLVWPNPLQWVSEFTDVLSLSLRLFGNIGGEHMTALLVMAIVPYGIPLIMHTLGLIPAFVQALVFTLLTASYMASAIHREEKKPKRARRKKKGTAIGAGEVPA